MRSRTGHVTHLVSASLNITEQKQVEGQLRESEAHVEPCVVCNPESDDLMRRRVHVRADAPAVAEPLGALDLDRRKITVERIIRGGDEVAFDEAFRLRPGDEIEMSGSADAFIETAALFRSAESGGRDVESPARLAVSGDGAGGDGEAASVRPKVYGADWCALTSGFRTYLDRKDIPHDYYDVEKDEAAADAVRAIYGGKLKFPTVVVGDREMKNPTLDELDDALASVGLLPEQA